MLKDSQWPLIAYKDKDCSSCPASQASKEETSDELVLAYQKASWSAEVSLTEKGDRKHPFKLLLIWLHTGWKNLLPIACDFFLPEILSSFACGPLPRPPPGLEKPCCKKECGDKRGEIQGLVAETQLVVKGAALGLTGEWKYRDMARE